LKIEFFNRYTGRVETEAVYGDSWVRFAYGNPFGRLALHALVKRAWFSRWYGWRMNRPASRAKVQPFIARYGLDPAEFAEPADSFQTFNEFFFRRLRPEARPVDPAPDAAVFPADGRHLGFPDLAAVDGIFVKGAVFGLAALLRDPELAARFRQGAMVISRLCPVDYHRFHFPVDGIPDTPRLLNGPLYSVNPVALRQNIHIFTENKRCLGRIESPQFGLVLMLEVGATCVGGIDYTFAPGRPVARGAEKGFFRFGGSSLITLFEPGRMQLANDLVEQTRAGRELYARMGDRLGSVSG